MSRFLLTLTAVAAIAMTTAATATAAPTVRQYEGTVVSVDRDARTFRLRDSERGTITIRVIRVTRFERVAGFAGLRRGLTAIESTVRRSNGAWIARSVERSGGGGEHGGRDDRGGRGDRGSDD